MPHFVGFVDSVNSPAICLISGSAPPVSLISRSPNNTGAVGALDFDGHSNAELGNLQPLSMCDAAAEVPH